MQRHMRKRFGGELAFKVATLRERMQPYLGRRCPYCLETMRARSFSIDHIQPISREGSKSLRNLQMTCFRCNRSKSDLTHKEYAKLVLFLRKLGTEAERSVLRRLRARPAWIRHG